MSTQAGLSFEQAPPFSLPLQFFLSAPLFLLAAALLIVLDPASLASRWTPQALALTHALTLGFLAMAMLGALMQMLPVVAGSPLPRPRAVAWLAQVPLALGTLSLMAGFLAAEPIAFGIAVALLGVGFAVFLAAAAVSLVRATGNVTVWGMRLAVLSLLLTFMLGLALALMRAGTWIPPASAAALAAHLAFGLLGWVLLLVVGVAFQVVPMFQITPPYPPPLGRWLTPGLFVLLLIHAAAPALPARVATLVEAGLAAGILLFAVTTLALQARRRRKLPDVTLDFWRLGMASLIASVTVWTVAQFSPAWADSDAYTLLLAVLFIGGFGVSVVNGMLYKIVPFLAWFHLQAQLQARAGSIPTMKDMIAEGRTRWQFRFHLTACGLLTVGLFWPLLVRTGGLMLALSALLLQINLLSALRRFYRHGGRFI